ncbi:hypothetical protein Q8A67_025501 [Cirrhinus molitorella]|uniref:Uncharacterized protein n=1 Tax=Cirrhinus molitorella TaxID=172907 RepID=A0AA88P083_9TELE|nr:hypothetical protein Q8A67_025501 [Cirrhinus molitorella]
MLIRFDRLSPKKEEKHPPPPTTYSGVGDTMVEMEGETPHYSSFITSDEHEAGRLELRRLYLAGMRGTLPSVADVLKVNFKQSSVCSAYGIYKRKKAINDGCGHA